MSQQQVEIGFSDDARLIAGVDEAGRGPLAGPVVAAAVILPPECRIDGLRDSKKLSEARRESLVEIICGTSLAWALGVCTPQEIDELNILQASMLAMRRAVEALSVTPEFVQVDGNRCPKLSCPVEAVVGGDDIVPAISAASVLAKVHRDREMIRLHEQYPQYGFAKHKGYPTAEHLAALAAHGITPIHRRSYAPVRKHSGVEVNA